MSPLVNALIITAIGMGLVFIAILLLWGLMELMIRLTLKSAQAEQRAGKEAPEKGPVEAAEIEPDLTAVRRRAAAAAVAAALALKSGEGALRAKLPGETVSAWQSVRRAGISSMRSSAYSRKQRGTVK